MDDDNRRDFNVLSYTTDIEIAIEKKNRECAMTIGNKHFTYLNTNKEDAELAK